MKLFLSRGASGDDNDGHPALEEGDLVAQRRGMRLSA